MYLSSPKSMPTKIGMLISRSISMAEYYKESSPIFLLLLLSPLILGIMAERHGDACYFDKDCHNPNFYCNNKLCACVLAYAVPNSDLSTCDVTARRSCKGSETCVQNAACIDDDKDGTRECTCDRGFITVPGPSCDGNHTQKHLSICCPIDLVQLDHESVVWVSFQLIDN